MRVNSVQNRVNTRKNGAETAFGHKKGNILVTGAGGFIGSHCTKELLSRGFRVHGLDNFSTGNRGAYKFLEEFGKKHNGFVGHEADLCDTKTLMEILKDKIAAVIHFAAYSQVGESVKEPIKYIDNNTVNTIKLIEAMKNTNVNKLVFSSTAATYGLPERVPILETDRQIPINSYGTTKLVNERLILSAKDWLNGVIFRYFNACGADPNGFIGEAHNPESHLIPSILKVITEGDERFGQNFKIFGRNYSTHDGTCVRDYANVLDLADAHVRGLERILEGGSTEAYNLGSGEGKSVQQVVDACEQVTGKKIPIEEAPRREGDPDALVASIEKARKELGFNPKYSLEDSILQAKRWFSKPAYRKAA
jgi:UDP-glucose 4-epimerase